MWYIEEWTGLTGGKQTRILSEDEHRTLMCPSNVVFKSNDHDEVRKRYAGMTDSAKSMARKDVIEKMKMLRANSIERDKILDELSAALKKYGETVK